MGYDEQRISDQIDGGLLKQKEIEQTEEGNKVLADFMELQFQEANGLRMYSYDDWGYLISELEYSTSWSWIMPVWIKFRDLKIDKKEFDGYINNSRLHYKKVSNLGSILIDANSPSNFFPHLVEAVKWYQSTKK